MAVGTGIDSTMAVLVNTLNSFVIKHIEPMIFDQVLRHNPVLYRFWRKGPKVSGGGTLTWPVLGAAKANGGFYTGAQQLAHGVEDTIQPAEVLWRHSFEDVTIPRTDLLKANGIYSKVDLMKTKFDEAILNLRSRQSAALYGGTMTSTGAFSSTADPLGYDHFLQALDNPSTPGTYSTYAGIAHSNTFWQVGMTQNGVINANGAATLTQIQQAYGEASDGDLTPTLVIITQAGFNFLWGQLQAQQRFTRDDEMTKAGFEAFKFNRAVVVVDRNLPTQNALFFNEEFVDLVSHTDENYAVDPIIPGTPSERSINTKVVHTGNLRVKTVRYQARIYGAVNF